MKSIVFAISVVLISCIISFGQESRPLKILERPNPAALESAGTADVQGSVIVRVTFLANGTIGDVSVVKGITYRNLTELAVNAARLIKFEPEIINGKPLSKTKQLEYFYIPGGWQKAESPETNKAANRLYDEKADAVISKAIQTLGGDRYLRVSSQIGRGKYSVIKEKTVVSFQDFVDVIVFPEKERTEFRVAGVKTVQTNSGDTGWIYDGEQNAIRTQNEKQIANFRTGIRTSLDYLLRGHWKNDAELTYIGKRPATLGKRNDAVKLTFKDGLVVEFEFAADDGLPVKSLYKLTNADGEETKEEDHYAQFVDVEGVKVPFIIDRFTNGAQSSRLNYLSIDINKPVPDTIFAKPSDPKELKKDLKL